MENIVIIDKSNMVPSSDLSLHPQSSPSDQEDSILKFNTTPFKAPPIVRFEEDDDKGEESFELKKHQRTS